MLWILLIRILKWTTYPLPTPISNDPPPAPLVSPLNIVIFRYLDRGDNAVKQIFPEKNRIFGFFVKVEIKFPGIFLKVWYYAINSLYYDMVKKCNCCKGEKPIKEFCKNKNFTDGLNPTCRSCTSKRRIKKEKGRNWKQSLKEFNKRYCSRCDTVKSMDDFPNKTSTKDGKYAYCKICKSKSDRKYRDELKSKGTFKKWRRDEYLRNIETYKKQQKNYVRDHKAYYKKLRKSPLRTLKYHLRNRIYTAFKYRNMEKNVSTSVLLGCSFEHAKQHLESQFKDGMTWDNQGKWHIDHIIPLASAKTKEEMELLFNYKNLQPLWASENLSKGCKF